MSFNSARLLPTVFVTAVLLPVSPLRGARAQAIADATAYALRPLYKNGDTTRYKYTVRFTAPNAITDGLQSFADARFIVTMKETATSATPDGAAMLDDAIEKAEGVFDEREVELTGAMPRIAQARDRAGISSVTLTGGLEQIREPVRQVFLLLARTERSFVPAAPVRIGETWKFDRQDIGEYEGRTGGTGTLVGMETLDGRATFKIKVDFTSALKAPDLRKGGKVNIVSHFVGTANVDAQTFQPVRIQGASDDMLAGSEKARTEITLEPAKDAPKPATKEN